MASARSIGRTPSSDAARSACIPGSHCSMRSSTAGPEPSIRSWERSNEPQGTARDDLGFRIVLRYDPFPPEPLGADEQGPALH